MLLLALALVPGLAMAEKNIAPTGRPIAWSNGLSPVSDRQTETDSPVRQAAPALVDGDPESDLRLGRAEDSPKYQGAGILWTSVGMEPPPKTITRVEFVNGSWESSGDGAFCADVQLQFLLPGGGLWKAAGWTATPEYDYAPGGASNVTYVFKGPPTAVNGVRVMGKVHCEHNSSYWANAHELRVFDNSPEVTLWDTTATPAVLDTPDEQSINLGTRFRSTVAGKVTGVRFYKSKENTGEHIGSLWAADGTLLAQATFANETASGWQQADFATPVVIAAETTYTVSYLAPATHYSTTDQYFVQEYRAGHGLLYAPKDEDGGNGQYAYSAAPLFPNKSYRAENYWVDVVFVPDAH